jgi:hypothetical protein
MIDKGGKCLRKTNFRLFNDSTRMIEWLGLGKTTVGQYGVSELKTQMKEDEEAVQRRK